MKSKTTSRPERRKEMSSHPRIIRNNLATVSRPGEVKQRGVECGVGLQVFSFEIGFRLIESERL
jgi:hypothetical protein